VNSPRSKQRTTSSMIGSIGSPSGRRRDYNDPPTIRVSRGLGVWVVRIHYQQTELWDLRAKVELNGEDAPRRASRSESAGLEVPLAEDGPRTYPDDVARKAKNLKPVTVNVRLACALCHAELVRLRTLTTIKEGHGGENGGLGNETAADKEFRRPARIGGTAGGYQLSAVTLELGQSRLESTAYMIHSWNNGGGDEAIRLGTDPRGTYLLPTCVSGTRSDRIPR